jgi:hypothetical protein
MNLTDIVKDLARRQYLALFVLLAAYCRKLTSSDSKFPVSLSAAWQPVASGFAGSLFGGLVAYQGGMSAGAAILTTAVAAGGMGLGDMILVAACGDPAKAPGWARVMVFLYDDLTGGPGGGGSVTQTSTVAVVKTETTAIAPPASKRTRRFVSPLRIASYACFALLLAACGASLVQQEQDFAAATECVSKDWGQPIGTIASDCFGGILTAAEDAVADVEALFEKTHPDAGVTASFPYADDSRAMARLTAKRAALAGSK